MPAHKRYNYDDIYSCYLCGMKVTSITKLLKCSIVTVRRALEANGVPPAKKKLYDHALICKMYREGVSIPKICDALGCTSGCVIPVLRNNGIKCRSISDAVHLASKGDVHKTNKGYLGICDTKNHRMPYHRFVMEQHLGRHLTKDEVVHHIDGNPKNNSIDNLVVLSRSEHTKIHRKQQKEQKICQLSLK